MHEPIGFSGVQTLPNSLQSVGVATPRNMAGQAQPLVLPGWNPKGYLNNACHRIAVQVA